MTKAAKKAERTRTPVKHGEVATPKAAKSVRVGGKTIGGAGKEDTALAKARKVEDDRMKVKAQIMETAQKIMDWAKQNYDSKVYAWHRLVETTRVLDIANELAEHNITTYAKAIVHYRAITKAWREQEVEHETEAKAGA